MLTFRAGAAGAPSAAKAMGEHLLQQTLTPDMAVMAEYYQRGMSPPAAAEAAAARYAGEVVRGQLADPAVLDSLIQREVVRLGESMVDEASQPLPNADLVLRAIGAFVAADMIDMGSGTAALERNGLGARVDRLAGAADEARKSADYSSATATPRLDMHPHLAASLGIDLTRSLNAAQIANLLSGQRADGRDIDGKQKQRATQAIGDIFGMDETRLPTRDELEHVLAGRQVDGAPLASDDAERAVRRFQSVMGAQRADLTPKQRDAILSGRTATGGELTIAQYHERMDTSRSRIGYIDFTFSAPKSVSVAWAFAPTEAERGIILQAHHDAIRSVMGEIERHMGQASVGKGGRAGVEAGSIAWVSFDHYTARPTVAVPSVDAQGEAYTAFVSLKPKGATVRGDMQLHTHMAVMNVVMTESGRVGALNFGQLEGRLKEWGALYQAFLAANLRQHGAEMDLDERNGMACVTAIPEHVSEYFSKRTVNGTAAAREYAASLGLDWDTLDPGRQIGLLKQGVQDPRGAKSDDLGDLTAWKRDAEAIGYEHKSILKLDTKSEEISEAERLDRAYAHAVRVFEKELDRRASVDGSDARIAAAKGLIAAGIESAADVDAITRAFRERGVRQRGQETQLIWGEVKDARGRDRIGITTELHRQEESILIGRVRAAAGDKSAALTPGEIARAAEKLPHLDFSAEHGQAQYQLMAQLGTGGRLAVGIGVAGSGKTTLLQPLVAAWREQGRAVYGTALAWRQADELAATGIDSENTRAMASLLKAIERGRVVLDRDSVVVVDELGLLGTRQFNDLLEAQERQGFQIVAIGDPKQMQSVEAGNWSKELGQ